MTQMLVLKNQSSNLSSVDGSEAKNPPLLETVNHTWTELMGLSWIVMENNDQFNLAQPERRCKVIG